LCLDFAGYKCIMESVGASPDKSRIVAAWNY
jgi:hypothetical protein